MDLFEEKNKDLIPEEKHAPLSLRMCPEKLDDFFGQEHILGEGKLLRRAITADRISSIIFYGPPGIGKTALAMVISKTTGANFCRKNAVSSNVNEIRKVIETAVKLKQMNGQRTILLLDEIHRFNKAQQDVLLPEVEAGKLILIGTTTENPYFSVNAALISRSQIFEFKPLGIGEIKKVIQNALKNKEKGLGGYDLEVSDEAVEHIAVISDGDARRALNALELAVMTTAPEANGTIKIGLKEAEESIQKKAIVYDRDGDAHYDTISAYIKSMRGSDPDAALYWLAKMIIAGEDPRFIARRLVIAAAEDVGMADPQALVIANAAMQAAEFVGFPEARIPLAEGTIYVASSPKSNSAYLAIDEAIKDIEEGRTMDVPAPLKDASYPGAKDLGRGQGYKYAHSYKDHYVEQEYMPVKKSYYKPTNMGYERKVKEWMKLLKTMDENGQ